MRMHMHVDDSVNMSGIYRNGSIKQFLRWFSSVKKSMHPHSVESEVARNYKSFQQKLKKTYDLIVYIFFKWFPNAAQSIVI